jgi:proline iminopeptidase
LLLSDLERLRLELDIKRWLLFGGSWGSTLALAYAQAYPDAVSGLVLRGLFLASDDEVAWFVTGLSRFLPEAWTAFASGGDDQSCAGLLRRYHERVALDDVAAAGRWNAWESAVMSVGEAAPTSSSAADMATLARVRVQLHYLVNSCFLAPGQLLLGMKHLVGLPAFLVQGRRDLVCPPGTAYTVARHWPGAQLRVVEEGGHSSMHPAMARALVQATQDMKRLIAPI